MAVIEDCWFQAMQDEIHEFDRLEVWELVPRPIYVMVIALKWIYKVKLDEYGDVLKNKAPPVSAKGISSGGRKLLFGLKQHKGIGMTTLKVPDANNFFKGAVDPTLFTRKSGKHILLVQIYVDDIIFASTDLNACNIFSKEMSSKFQMSMMGQMSFFLGLQVSQSPGGIFINQAKYALETLKKYGMDLSDPVDTPMVDRLKLDRIHGIQLTKSISRNVGSSKMYLKPRHLEAFKRVFRYLKGTINMGLWYPKDNAMSLTAYAYADHAGCQDSRKKYVGNVLSLWEIDWLAGSSRKHDAGNIQLTEVNTLAHVGCSFLTKNSMAEQIVPAQPPTRTDEQIVPRSQWLTIGKSNLLFNAQKIQKNPIFQISVDILKNTNFFQALTASANVPAIYLQQFWKTMSYNEKTGVYSCQLDEQWFDLSADLLRNALAITPVKPTHPFELPPTGDTVLDFVNELGYPEPIEFVSSIRTNYVYQPWRAILSLLNQCLTGKTSGSDKPRHPVLQMLWGIVTQTNIDHAELIWEEFTQGIQTYFSHKASLKNPKKKATPLLIPYGRFSKVIIYYLARNNNIHRRPDSAIHYTGDDYVLGNLKFVPKGETVEVFGWHPPIP
ncbi:retrovirus-related pol polyprotein from transposon TNT 1-94 [Tanacetum coccineum]